MDEPIEDLHRQLLQKFHEYATIDTKYQINPTFRSARKTRAILREIKKLCALRVKELVRAKTPEKMQARIDKNWGRGHNNWLKARKEAQEAAKQGPNLPDEDSSKE